MKDTCPCCNVGIDPEEIYTDYFYCAVCHKSFPYCRERLNPEDVLEVNNVLRKTDEKDLKPIELDEFEISLMELIRKDVKPSKSVCDSPNTENKENP